MKARSWGKILHRIIISCFALLFTQQSKSGGIIGGEITYTSLGSDKYTIIFKAYWNCKDGAPDDSIIFSVNPQINGNSSIELLKKSQSDVTPLCPTGHSACVDTSQLYGVQEYTYKGIVTLPSPAAVGGYTFSYSYCCRSSTINTLQNPDSSFWYSSVTIDPSLATDNNSPQFMDPAFLFAIKGQPMVFSNSAMDKDGDSLAYSLIPCQVDANFAVDYLPLYSYEQFLSSATLITLDSKKAELKFTPNQLQTTVVAIQVDEFRNGVKIGQVVRDCEIIVIQSNDLVPVISEDQTNYIIIAGRQRFLGFYCTDADMDTAKNRANISFSTDIDPSHISYSYTGPGQGAKIDMTIHLTCADVRDQPYVLNIFSYDNACPIIGKTSKTVLIKVLPYDSSKIITNSPVCLGKPIAFTGQQFACPYLFLWDFGDGSFDSTRISPNHVYAMAGTYHVELMYVFPSGTITITDSVVVSRSPLVSFTTNPPLISSGVPITFINNSSTGSGYSYLWDFGDHSTSRIFSPTHTYGQINHPVHITLTVTNSTGCETGIDTIIEFPATALFTPDTIVCVGEKVNCTNLSLNAKKYIWDFGDGSPRSTSKNVKHSYALPGTFTIMLISSNNFSADTINHNVVVLAKPVPNFVPSTTTVCTGNSVTFVNTSSNATSYRWNFKDGTPIVTDSSPAHTFMRSGTFRVILTASNGVCEDSMQQNIHVNATPQAQFLIADTNACEQSTIKFLNQTLQGHSFRWGFGDGTGSTQRNPAHTYNSVGTYKVSLVALNGNCADTTSQTLHIFPSPQSLFNFSMNPACAGSPVTFQNHSLFATDYIWFFGDGDTSHLENPVHSYISAGSYKVKLFVSNTHCVDSLEQTISITPSPQAVFQVTDTNGCQLSKIFFVNRSIQAKKYNWMFGDGSSTRQTNPSHVYTTTGVYTVTLVATNGICSDTMRQTLHIFASPQSLFEFSQNPACSGTPVIFQNRSPSANDYIWFFGDGDSSHQENPVHSYVLGGNYIVKLFVSNGHCIDSTEQTISITASPQAIFQVADTNGCQFSKMFFVNTSTQARKYKWSFGDGSSSTQTNPSHIYKTAGVFMVTLVAINGICFDTTERAVHIFALPQSSFEFNQSPVCSGSPISFQNRSIAAIDYVWFFGDGDTSHQESPVHSYTLSGNYIVKLFSSNNICVDSVQKIILVTPSPQAQFQTTDTNVCAGSKVTFVNQSAQARKYLWYFGDGANSTQTSPNHIYTSAGTYTVTLIAIYGDCFDTTKKTIHVFDVPQSIFTFNQDSACTGSLVTFTNQSISATSFFWLFGDGDSSHAANPAHLYTTANSYVITLYAGNGNCIDSSKQTITVKPSPLAGFTIVNSPLCDGMQVQFQNNSVGAQSYKWDFGDSNTSNATNPKHLYALSGSYTVQLIAIRSVCLDTFKTVIVIHPNPIADFTTNPFLIKKNIPIRFLFTGITTDSSTYLWNFGDNATSPDSSPTHIYTTGLNAVKIILIVTNKSGCSDTISRTIAFVPTAAFISDTIICLGTVIKFNNHSTGAQSYLWNFGDSTATVTQTSPPHLFTSAGNYTVTLIATNTAGSDTIKSGVQVMSIPAAGFTVENTVNCESTAVQFTNISTNAITFVWNFGDATSLDTNKNPIHIFTTAGTFYVSLLAMNTTCSDTSFDTIFVIPQPVSQFIILNDSICIGTPSQFQNMSTGALSYYWSFGDSTTDSLMVNPTHLYTSPGGFLATLIAKGAACSDTSSRYVVIHSKPVAQFITIPPVFQSNVPITFQYTGTSDIGMNYFWSFGDSSTSILVMPTHTYSIKTGSVTVTLTVTNQFGCIDSISHLLQFQASAGFVSDAPVCAGLPVHFTDSSINTQSYMWSFGDGGYSTQKNPTHIFISGGTFVVMLIATGAGGADTLADTVQIHPQPKVDFKTEPEKFGTNESVSFINMGTTGSSVTYLWNFGDGSTSTSENPSHSYSGNILHTAVRLKIINEFGCIDSIEKVIPFTSLVQIPNAFSPNGDGVNDEFYIVGISLINSELKIYNQWGEVVFESNDVGAGSGWDGTYKGKVQDMGVYLYYFKAEGADGQKYFKKGNITLLR